MKGKGFFVIFIIVFGATMIGLNVATEKGKLNVLKEEKENSNSVGNTNAEENGGKSEEAKFFPNKNRESKEASEYGNTVKDLGLGEISVIAHGNEKDLENMEVVLDSNIIAGQVTQGYSVQNFQNMQYGEITFKINSENMKKKKWSNLKVIAYGEKNTGIEVSAIKSDEKTGIIKIIFKEPMSFTVVDNKVWAKEKNKISNKN